MKRLHILTPLFLWLPISAMAMVASSEGECTITPKGGTARHAIKCTLTEGTCTAAGSFASISFCDDSGPKDLQLHDCYFDNKRQKYKQGVEHVKSETQDGDATRYQLKDGTIIVFKESGSVDPGEEAECIPRKK